MTIFVMLLLIKSPTKIKTMQRISINLEKRSITIFNEKKDTWETCNFQEAGIPDEITDKEEIQEVLTEHEDVEIIFE